MIFYQYLFPFFFRLLIGGHHDVFNKLKQNGNNSNFIDDIVKRKALEVSMSRSDTGFTTWSKLKKVSTSQLQRYV